MGAKDRGPRPRADPARVFAGDLRDAFAWRGDRTDRTLGADVTGWWADPGLLAGLGPALTELFAGLEPTVVLGPQSRGALLGALVALHLGVGLVEVRKNPTAGPDSERWLIAHSPPDYRDRNLRVGVRRALLPSTARVLFVDDWIETGGQAEAARDLVGQAAARWCGAAVIVDALRDSRLRRDLDVRSIFRINDL